MFDLETRKKTTNKILDFLTKLLKQISDKEEISGLIVFIFHWLFLGIPLIVIKFLSISSPKIPSPLESPLTSNPSS